MRILIGPRVFGAPTGGVAATGNGPAGRGGGLACCAGCGGSWGWRGGSATGGGAAGSKV